MELLRERNTQEKSGSYRADTRERYGRYTGYTRDIHGIYTGDIRERHRRSTGENPLTSQQCPWAFRGFNLFGGRFHYTIPNCGALCTVVRTNRNQGTPSRKKLHSKIPSLSRYGQYLRNTSMHHPSFAIGIIPHRCPQCTNTLLTPSAS